MKFFTAEPVPQKKKERDVRLEERADPLDPVVLRHFQTLLSEHHTHKDGTEVKVEFIKPEHLNPTEYKEAIVPIHLGCACGEEFKVTANGEGKVDVEKIFQEEQRKHAKGNRFDPYAKRPSGYNSSSPSYSPQK